MDIGLAHLEENLNGMRFLIRQAKVLSNNNFSLVHKFIKTCTRVNKGMRMFSSVSSTSSHLPVN